MARWFEHVESCLTPEITLKDGRGIVYRHKQLRYLAGWPDDALLADVLGRMAAEAGLATVTLPPGVRLRRAGDISFAFNYGSEPADISGIAAPSLIIGTHLLPPAGVAAWQVPA